MAFVNFADLITFTRASSGTRVNASGVIETITSGNPRFDYDPVSLEPRGLLIEEQRTNLLLRSSDYSAAWGALTGITLTTAQASPDGGTNATKVECTTTGATRILTQTATVTSAASYTFSVYLKKGTSNYAVVALADSTATNQALWTFDLNAGSVAQNLITTIASVAGIQSVGNGWYRCWVQIAAPGTSVQARAFPTSGAGTANGNTGDNVIMFGAQLEAGPFATSYIATAASQVTRSADVPSIIGTDFSDWFNRNEGTFVADFSSFATTASSRVVLEAFQNAINYIATYIDGNGKQRNQVTVAGSQTFDSVSVATVTNGPSHRDALAYKSNNFGSSLDGETAQTDSSGALPSPVALHLGHENGAAFLNGHIRSIRFYPERLSDTKLQELSA
jgi:hypothetical protein